MSDTLYGGRRFLAFNIPDEGVREGLAIEVDTSLPAERVIRVLEQEVAWQGQLQAIRLDNGPAFLADRVASWCVDSGIALRCIRPGQPNLNAFIERFNRTFRHEGLDAYVFESLDQVRRSVRSGCGSTTRSGPMTPWPVSPAKYRAQITQPVVLFWKSILDGGATIPSHSIELREAEGLQALDLKGHVKPLSELPAALGP